MAVSLDAPQSLNRYSYVSNMPLSYFDPFGLDSDVYFWENGCLIHGHSSSTNSYGNGGIVDTVTWTYETAWCGSSPGSGGSCPSGVTCGPHQGGGGGGAANNGLDPNSTLGWTWNFTKSFFSVQPQIDAWNKGYYKCLAQKNLPGFSAVATTHVAGDVASETASHFAPQIAGAYYHFTDARFTAWGKYSKVLVPEAAGSIKLWAGRLNAAGWAYADYELAKSIGECSEVLK